MIILIIDQNNLLTDHLAAAPWFTGFHPLRIDIDELKARTLGKNVLAGLINFQQHPIEVKSAIARWRQLCGAIPLMVILPSSAQEEVGSVLASGADECFSGPLDYSQVAARFCNMLHRDGCIHGSVIHWRDLRIDRLSSSAHLLDRQIDLSPSEFLLLSYLASHRGLCLSRSQLRARCTAFPSRVVSNDIDQLVTRLRRKLKHAGCPDPIKTVRGVGYRMIEEWELQQVG